MYCLKKFIFTNLLLVLFDITDFSILIYFEYTKIWKTMINWKSEWIAFTSQNKSEVVQIQKKSSKEKWKREKEFAKSTRYEVQERAIEVDQVVQRLFNSVKTVTQLSMEIKDSTRRKFSITLQVTSKFRRVPLKGNRVTVSYVRYKIVGNTVRIFETRRWLSSWRRI